MKVKDLHQRLSKLDPELDVLCYTDDAKLITGNRGFRLLEIKNVDTRQGEQFRLDRGSLYLKLSAGPASVTLAALAVTADF